MYSPVPNVSVLISPQFDADRDEDAVFYDISLAVDNKLFPNKEATAGESLSPCGGSTAG